MLLWSQVWSILCMNNEWIILLDERNVSTSTGSEGRGRGRGRAAVCGARAQAGSSPGSDLSLDPRAPDGDARRSRTHRTVHLLLRYLSSSTSYPTVFVDCLVYAYHR